MNRLVLMGAPGAGKGTQGKQLAQKLHIPIVSMGDLLREKKNENSSLGNQIKEIMAQGAYVPDEVVVAMLKERLGQQDCTDGFILDGFPRTVSQADTLDQMLEEMGIQLDAVLHIMVPKEKIVSRLTGRRICPACGREYHIEFNPSKNGDHCECEAGAELIQREDDTEATILKRLEVYAEHTTPLVDYYKRKELLKEINGVGTLPEVAERMQEALS